MKLINDNNLLHSDDVYIKYSNNPKISEATLFDQLIKPFIQKVNLIDIPLSINNINAAIISLINSYRCIPYEYIYDEGT